MNELLIVYLVGCAASFIILLYLYISDGAHKRKESLIPFLFCLLSWVGAVPVCIVLTWNALTQLIKK